MLRWLRDWLRPPPEEEQLELPFDPPLPRHKRLPNNQQTPTDKPQEIL